MTLSSFSVAALLALASVATAQNCTVQFDGRVPAGTPLTALDASNKYFVYNNVLGQGLTWSQVLKTPNVTGTIFDKGTIPVEVTINDKSVFAPSSTNIQTGFRRAELIPASNTGSDASTTGVKTLHFSVQKDPARPLNFSHEYQLFFLESADYSTNQVVLKTGNVLGQTVKDPDSLQIWSNVNTPKILWQTAFTAGSWHNFALTLDFTKNTTQVYYSSGASALKRVTAAVPNDVSGRGQYHFGILKKPTNGGSDITKSGFQPAGINEGVYFGSIFQEDSSTGCVSLKKK